MTTIKKLSIQGIRSYSDKEPEVIEFFHPLTIIVGANGSGKTSIIEALKFGCTGSIPPLSDNGKSFVYDPKVVGTAVVKAQIKLGFRTVDNRPVLAIRSFQLTQKKERREFKQLETILRTRNDEGKEVSISHRCSDMEKQVPQLMGVSKAVLENVIFCHQEDSNWPLSESKVLKQKFDDIFSATRFTKALDVIKKLRAEQSKDIRFMEADLKVLTHNVECSEKLQDDLENAKQKVKGKTDKIREIVTEVHELEESLAGVTEKAEHISAVKAEIKTLQSQHTIMEQEMELSLSRITLEYTEDDEALQLQYEKFTRDMESISVRIEEEKSKLAAATRSYESSSAAHTRLQRAVHMQEVEEKAQATRRADLATKRAELSSVFSISVPDSSADVFQELLQASSAAVTAKQQQLASIRQESKKQDAAFERNIAALRSKESACAQEVKTKNATLAANRDNLVRIANSCDQISSSLGQRSDTGSRIQQTQAEIQEFDAADISGQLAAQVAQNNREIQANAKKIGALTKEREGLEGQLGLVLSVQAKREAYEKVRDSHNSKLAGLSSSLQTHRLVLATTPHPLPSEAANAETVFTNASGPCYSPHVAAELQQQHSKATAKREKAEQQLQEARQKTTSITARLQAVSHSLKELQHKAAEAAKQLSDAGVGEDIRTQLSALEKKLEKYKQDKVLNNSAKLLYQKFLAVAQQNSFCPLCDRTFADEELQQFLTKNREKMEKVTNETQGAKIKRKIKAHEQKIQQYKGLLSVWDNRERWEKVDIPDLQVQQQQLQAEETDSSSSLDSFSKLAATHKEQEGRVQVCAAAAAAVGRLFGEAQDLYFALSEEEGKLADVSRGGRDLAAVQNELREVERSNVALAKRQASLQQELETARQRRSDLQQKLNKYRDISAEINRKQLQFENLNRERSDLVKQQEVLKGEVANLNTGLAPLKERIRQLYDERREARAEQEKREEEAQEQVTKLRLCGDSFAALLLAVQQYEETEGDRERTKKQLQQSTQERQTMSQRLERMRAKIAENEALRSERKTVEADITANIEYRNRKAALARHARLISDRSRELEEMLDGEDIVADLADFRSDLDRLNTAKAELSGALLAEEQQAKMYMEELDSERYRGVNERYTAKQIQYRTTVQANKDLDTYHKALDEALMRFHADKMKQINEVLREYWRSTYQGKDIDEVLIKAERVETATKRRNYNYRVVMRQGDTELNMRGRCSAGQKVLASLLIRLALAETFCLQCGVLALDEPTTNLDDANIRAFANALSSIINKRSGQKNFQLVLITHDDEFVEKIGNRAHCDYYYRVYKDAVSQNSRIRKQRL